MTKEQQRISDCNRQVAIEYFEATGELPINRDSYEYVLHHKDKTLRHNNVERYILWNIEDLCVVTKAEHNRIHTPDFVYDSRSGENNPMYGVHRYGELAPTYGKVWTDDQRKHASDAQKKRYQEHPENFKKPEGFMVGEKNPMYGRHHSEETKRKISEAAKRRAAEKRANND